MLSGRFDGCDESPHGSGASPLRPISSAVISPSCMRHSPDRVLLCASRVSKPRFETNTLIQTDKVDNAIVEGRLSPEIPLLWPVSRTLESSLCKTDWSSGIHLMSDIDLAVNIEEQTSILSSSLVAMDGKRSSFTGPRSAVYADIAGEVDSLSTSAHFEPLIHFDYVHHLFQSSDNDSQSFKGFSDFSEGEINRIDELSDIEFTDFEPQSEANSCFSSGLGAGPRPSSTSLCSRMLESQDISDCENLHYCEAVQNTYGTEAPLSLAASETLSFLSHVEERISVDDGLLSKCPKVYAADACPRDVLVDNSGGTRSLDVFIGEPTSVNNDIQPKNGLQSSDTALQPTVSCDEHTVSSMECSLPDPKHVPGIVCSPPIPTSPASGCKCWQPVIRLTKLNRTF